MNSRVAPATASTPAKYMGYQGNPGDNQAVFDFVAGHLLRQRRKSEAPKAEGQPFAFCLFRGPGGSMCAGGCLVPDADYAAAWEEDGEIRTNANAVSHYFARRGFDLDLLSALQEVHDNALPEDWDRELRQVADNFALVRMSFVASAPC
jgi:hypothetical protein